MEEEAAGRGSDARMDAVFLGKDSCQVSKLAFAHADVGKHARYVSGHFVQKAFPHNLYAQTVFF